MNPIFLSLTPRDPIIARDSRPFGSGQGNRMRGLAWPLPSVVAGSFRTAIVKANESLDFAGNMPQRLMAINVAGVFPVHSGELYLPAPSDAVAKPVASGKPIETIHRVIPQELDGGDCDFPENQQLLPVMLPGGIKDFKPADLPAWWPLAKYVEWLTSKQEQSPSNWLTKDFLSAAKQETRDHVCLDPNTGAAAESQLFATAGLNVTHLPRYGVRLDDKSIPFDQRFTEITLLARVTMPPEANFEHVGQLKTWHPLGGERRLVHWQANGDANLWKCPDAVKQILAGATQIRMVLATPAIFEGGWKPGWLNDQLEGSPPASNIKLKLVGVSNGRWKAVSGWSLAPPRGPKPIRRMVPAGSVYFFRTSDNAASLAEHWLQSVSDGDQEQRDGFGLALWGTW